MIGGFVVSDNMNSSLKSVLLFNYYYMTIPRSQPISGNTYVL